MPALWLLVAAAMAVSALAGPVGKTPASPSPAPKTPPGPKPGANAVTAAERACLDDLKLLYPGDGRCHQLLSTGPCKSHEWLVLDARAPDRLRPVCARVPCAEREVLWPRDGRCYQRYRDRDLLCPHARNLLVPNPFGLGECSCMRTPPHARDAAAGGDGACHPLFHRGPCAEGEVLMPRANGTADQGECARDPCHREGQAGVRAGEAPAMPMVLWPTDAGGDGKCHALGAMDVCPESATFGIHPQTLRPSCIVRINHLLPPTPCSGDRCSPTNTAAYSEGYIKELFQAHKSHKNFKRAG
ncbi:uncharacterized protein LOC117649092 [Thrips palmi]|uniref:Uncharacterized protein LOC117649092 n=1 Tax=Thrips palmi TaxID=161013 RepID=A0A6P8Z4I6_THRPL|nr:uncharacterized protein LOC117649092 [Thrips palmi]